MNAAHSVNTGAMRLLVVEDDLSVNQFIAHGLREQGHAVDTADNGRAGLEMATSERYDVIVLDRMLPEIDGITVLKTLRSNENSTPVLLLSALGDVDDRVEGLKAGGDDYLVKPFAFVELLARIEVLGRRAHSTQLSDIILQCGDLTMDVLARKVTRGSETIILQAREFKLLEFLFRHKNQIVTRDMLLGHVWGYHFDPQTNVIDVHISRLRQKLDTNGHSYITTIRGTGYTMTDPAMTA